MLKQGGYIALLILLTLLLGGCVGTLWTSASMVYDRHSFYEKVSDYRLAAKVNNALYRNQLFKHDGCSVDVAVLHGDILLVGHVPTDRLKNKALDVVGAVSGYKRVYNELTVDDTPASSLQDSWITAKIRTQILADASINPNGFKVITADGVVYLLGEVKRSEGEKIITIARNTSGVVKVVKILKYYTYESKVKVA